MQHHRIKGFTLVEMLVVLVLVSLVMTLTMQGLSSALDLRGRVIKEVVHQQTTRLQQYWLRSVVASLYPEQVHRTDVFKGDRQKISGLTLAPLISDTGIPVPFTLSIQRSQGQASMVYREADFDPWVLATWQDTATGGFRFRDADGKWTSKWPVNKVIPADPQQEQIQLPALIDIEMIVNDQRMNLWVPVLSRKAPKVDLQRLIEGNLL